jgi:hypothetical protein
MMKLAWTYYAAMILAFIAFDVVATIKFWRIKRIRERQARRARKAFGSFEVDGRTYASLFDVSSRGTPEEVEQHGSIFLRK